MPGVCYRLYTKARAQTFKKAQNPDILRFSLDKIILHIKSLSIPKLESFIGTFLTKPENRAIVPLQQSNALCSKKELTSLGHFLSCLPLDPVAGMKSISLLGNFRCINI